MKDLLFRNGDPVPILGLGTWKSEKGEIYHAIRTAINNGYRHIDCAAAYGNETEIGRAIKDVLKEEEIKRTDLFITSKLWNDSHQRDEVKQALQRSLTHLGLHYLDLYLIHWPVAIRKNATFPPGPSDLLSPEDVPLEDTWRAMEDCREEKLTRHIGVSNFGINRLNQLIRSCEVVPEMNQFEIHPYLLQNELVSFCRDHNILVTGYSPLGSADRPDRMKRENEPSLFENLTIQELAEENNITKAQVILSWIINRGIAVIPKSVNKNRLIENINAAEIHLNTAQMKKMNALNMDFRYITSAIWEVENGSYTSEYIWGG